VGNWKWIVLGGCVAVAVLALAGLSGCTAQAEDYCDTVNILNQGMGNEDTEKKIREKCKVGDIIVVSSGEKVGRLCDLRQPVVSGIAKGSEGWGSNAVCFLAPPRKTY